MLVCLEDADMMVPSPLVEGDERHAGLDQAAGQQAPLAEGIPAVGVADHVGLVADVEGPLGVRRGHQVVALLVVGVERQRRIACGLIGEATEAVDARTQVATAVEPMVVQSPRRRHVADLEGVSIRVIGDHERGILRPQEIRPARPRHARNREIRGHPAGQPRARAR